MLKNLTSIALILAFCTSQAQLKILDPTHPGADLNNTTINVSGTPADNDLEFALTVENISSQTYTIKCRRTEVNVLPGSSNTTCWVLCPPYVNQGEYPVMVIGQQNSVEYEEVVPAGGTVTGFLAHYGPNNTEGSSLFLYEFFDAADPSTALASINGRFTHEAITSLTENNDFEFSMFPNPANSQLNFKVDETNLTVQVLDLLGKTVIEKKTLINNGSIAINDLKNGVYFVSVSKNGIVLKTEKLIIKH